MSDGGEGPRSEPSRSAAACGQPAIALYALLLLPADRVHPRLRTRSRCFPVVSCGAGYRPAWFPQEPMARAARPAGAGRGPLSCSLHGGEGVAAARRGLLRPVGSRTATLLRRSAFPPPSPSEARVDSRPAPATRWKTHIGCPAVGHAQAERRRGRPRWSGCPPEEQCRIIRRCSLSEAWRRRRLQAAHWFDARPASGHQRFCAPDIASPHRNSSCGPCSADQPSVWSSPACPHLLDPYAADARRGPARRRQTASGVR